MAQLVENSAQGSFGGQIMLVSNQSRESCIPRLCRTVVKWIAAVGVAGMTALLVNNAAVVADPPASGQTEQWGPCEGDRRTRLVPLADHFTLGQPMRFRLELKNVGQTIIYYDTQQVDINASLAVRDPRGRTLPYTAQSFQTMGGKPPALTPGNVVYLFDGLDIDSQYLIVKPGRYSVEYRGGEVPKSNAVEIDVRPGTLPPIKRIATRMLGVLPSDWAISVHGYPHESDSARACYWDEPPAGWEPVRGMPTVELVGNRRKGGGVRAKLWLNDRKLKWTGKVDHPGETAAIYHGRCPEGYLYGHLPSEDETATAKWPTFERDIKRAIQVEEEATAPWVGDPKNDEDLKHIKTPEPLDSLFLDNAQITDAGLKSLEHATQLKALWLRYTRITDQGLSSLGKLPQLQSVFLDGDSITDAGLENLQGMTQLKGVSLDGTKITDAGLQRLQGMAQLDFLSLRETAITNAGLETVERFTHLRSLELDNTRITDAGLQRIKGLTKITRLSLANTGITDAGLESLRGLTQLTSLDLDNTHVTDEGVQRLQRGLPRCTLYYKSAEQHRRWWKAQEEEHRKAERESSAISREQSIPRSGRTKHYVMKFDKPGLKRQPLLVIVWKAKGIPSTALSGFDTPTPVIVVNEHLLKPPRTKKAVYALQPDYSLQPLPLTDKEIERLFSHITRSEERAVSVDEVQTLPPNTYWEEKVDPHLKVVEPAKKKKRL
jgi:hypothetical protein